MKAFCNGCFDLFHVGHLYFLKEAYEACGHGKVVVGLNSDEYVLRTKGRKCRPLAERKVILECLVMVDEVIPFQEDSAVELMKKVCPGLYCTGEEYKDSPEVQYALQNGIRVHYIPRVGEWSTTKELERSNGCD